MDVAEVVSLEREIAEGGTPLLELMMRAGHAVADAVVRMVSVPDRLVSSPVRVLVLAGAGNNGGDGWVAAARLARHGYDVTLVSRTLAADIKAEPARTAALEAASEDAFAVLAAPGEHVVEDLAFQADVIVDAILGTGFAHADVREPYASWIRLANGARRENDTPVLAVDCPSGLDAQTGKLARDCIEATATVTMLAVKRGLLEDCARAHVGDLFLAALK